MKGWSKLRMPFLIGRSRKLDIVHMCKKKGKEKKINICWSPPQPMVWKWNVDGSTEGKPEPAGIYSRDFLEQ
jgi:hypothetical protein